MRKPNCHVIPRDTVQLKTCNFKIRSILSSCFYHIMSRVYIGDLGSGGSKPEIEREFERFGTLKSVWVARNPPGK